MQMMLPNISCEVDYLHEQLNSHSFAHIHQLSVPSYVKHVTIKEISVDYICKKKTSRNTDGEKFKTCCIAMSVARILLAVIYTFN